MRLFDVFITYYGRHSVVTEETPRKHRPQVLLVGNGIDRLFNDNAWQSFLHKFADENYPVPEDILSVLPFPLQYEALTAHSNDDAKKEKLKNLPQNIHQTEFL